MGVLTETEQALRVEVRDLLLIIRVDGYLIEELSSGLHAAVWIVRGEENAADTDRDGGMTPRLCGQGRTITQLNS
jgi:hypothetical protein